MYEVIIVGAGPAGLSAALILGRCRRHVLICDTGEYRNYASHALHGFLSRDGISPRELLQLGREQLQQFETVELRRARVVDAALQEGHFSVTLEDGTRHQTRKLLLATGVRDELPRWSGLRNFTGEAFIIVPTAMAGNCAISHWRFTARSSTGASWLWSCASGARI